MDIKLPGLCDVHVHFREPGFSYKESIKSGSRAAAAGGYTAVCTMPNLDPVSDSTANLQIQLDIIKKDAAIAVLPYAAITLGQQGEKLSDMEALAPHCVAFSDDGRGVQSEEMMLRAMLRAKVLGKIIAAHCEDNTLIKGGYIHEGKYAAAHGHKGICSRSEYTQIERDIKLAAESGCVYHVCHVSCAESVELIRKAKADGIDISCETAPHYLALDENDIREDGRFKMNPPLRSREDRLALIKGVQDGTIEIIATDHAPHSAEEKAKGLEGSSFGIVGLETAFPVLYTRLVKEGLLSLEDLVRLLSDNPRKRFGIRSDAGFSLWDLDEEYVVEPENFLSKGRATPFEGDRVFGRCLATFYKDHKVFSLGAEPC